MSPEDFAKLKIESKKHITTFAAGTLALLGAFLPKAPMPLHAKRSLFFAIAGMVLAILASIIVIEDILGEMRTGGMESDPKRAARFYMSPYCRAMDFVAYVAFLAGTAGLCVFIVYNTLEPGALYTP